MIKSKEARIPNRKPMRIMITPTTIAPGEPLVSNAKLDIRPLKEKITRKIFTSNLTILLQVAKLAQILMKTTNI